MGRDDGSSWIGVAVGWGGGVRGAKWIGVCMCVFVCWDEGLTASLSL